MNVVLIGVGQVGSSVAQPFTSFLDAEIDVEIELEGRTVEIGSDDPARQLTVNLAPSNWFVSDNGNPTNLSLDQYQNPGEEPVEFEIEFQQESEVEFDD
jgi:homoserine dehydrogenase